MICAYVYLLVFIRILLADLAEKILLIHPYFRGITNPFGVQGARVMAGDASLVGMFGNLVFAAIKRDRGVKVWSHLIPGQGGIIDQLDSVVFAAPIFYHLTKFFWAA